MDSDKYLTIRSTSNGLYKEKGSRFISFAYSITDPKEIKPILDGLKKEHHEAKHLCFAYMLGKERTLWRVSDGGEPSGTAGRPILGQINASGLTNIFIVVIRYFGGTLLGVSGLINAYRTAAASAIENAEIIEYTLREYYEITYPFQLMNDVMRILKEENIGQSDQLFDSECCIKINFRASAREKNLHRLSRLDGLKYTFIETR